jgi:hypothetical protein
VGPFYTPISILKLPESHSPQKTVTLTFTQPGGTPTSPSFCETGRHWSLLASWLDMLT